MEFRGLYLDFPGLGAIYKPPSKIQTPKSAIDKRVSPSRRYKQPEALDSTIHPLPKSDRIELILSESGKGERRGCQVFLLGKPSSDSRA